MDRPFPAYKGDEPYVFVSYAHEDSEVVFPEIQWLKDQGFNIWFDEGISPGHEWHQELADRIVQSSLFLYFITGQSAASEHCQREVHYAIDNGKQLLTVHLEETVLPGGINLSLSSIQAIMRHELSDLDYRIKLLNGTSDHIKRGISVAAEPTPKVNGFSGKVTAAISIAMLLIGGLIVGLLTSRSASESDSILQPRIRFTLDQPEGILDVPESILQPLALSNDGSRVVFSRRTTDGWQLFSRALNDLSAVPIRGTVVDQAQGMNGAGNFALSPDGECVAFVEDATIRKVRLSGGQSVTVCEIEEHFFLGMAWGPTGTIVFGNFAYAGLMQVADSGGVPEPVTHVNTEENEIHAQPTFTPNGKALLFASANISGTGARIMLRSLNSGEERFLLDGDSPQITSSGHLLFNRDGILWATAFDLKKLVTVGKPVPVVEGVRVANRTAQYSVSTNGILTYWSGDAAIIDESAIVWVDRNGNEDDFGLRVFPSQYSFFSLSPNGEGIALATGNPTTGIDLWVYTFARDMLTRLTFDQDESTEAMPLWSADSKRIIYFATGQGLQIKNADARESPSS